MPVYPESIDHLSELRAGLVGDAFPAAANCARELVTLPTHDYLTEKDATLVGRLLSLALA
jgi:dTDP-4-amino-4,6-dideoxygalactose transaminase